MGRKSILDDLFRRDPKIPKCGHSQKGHLLASGTWELGKIVKSCFQPLLEGESVNNGKGSRGANLHKEGRVGGEGKEGKRIKKLKERKQRKRRGKVRELALGLHGDILVGDTLPLLGLRSSPSTPSPPWMGGWKGGRVERMRAELQDSTILDYFSPDWAIDLIQFQSKS